MTQALCNYLTTCCPPSAGECWTRNFPLQTWPRAAREKAVANWAAQHKDTLHSVYAHTHTRTHNTNTIHALTPPWFQLGPVTVMSVWLRTRPQIPLFSKCSGRIQEVLEGSGIKRYGCFFVNEVHIYWSSDVFWLGTVYAAAVPGSPSLCLEEVQSRKCFPQQGSIPELTK